jgi:hypothetical protein
MADRPCYTADALFLTAQESKIFNLATDRFDKCREML